MMDGIATSSAQFASCNILIKGCLWAAGMKAASLPGQERSETLNWEETPSIGKGGTACPATGDGELG